MHASNSNSVLSMRINWVTFPSTALCAMLQAAGWQLLFSSLFPGTGDPFGQQSSNQQPKNLKWRLYEAKSWGIQSR